MASINALSSGGSSESDVACDRCGDESLASTEPHVAAAAEVRRDRFFGPEVHDVLEANVDRVRPHCSITDLPKRLTAAFEAAGWSVW